MSDNRLVFGMIVTLAIAVLAAMAVGDDGVGGLREDPAAKKKAAEVLSVQEFQALKPRWSNLAAVGVTVTIEGRLISRFDKGLRLYHCDVRFVPPRDQKLVKLPKGTTNVQVSGTLIKDGSRFRVIVKSLAERPTDEVAFTAMKAKLPFKESAPWYRAGDWAVQRGKFYSDPKLGTLGRDAYARGVAIERAELPAGDDKAVFQLALKAKRLLLPDAAVLELIHEGYRTRWSRQAVEGKSFNYSALLAGLGKDLPGADSPLKAVPAALAAKYRTAPQTTYAAADETTRKTLHRLFYLDVAWRQLELTVDATGANGFEVAADIEKRLPEYKSQAEPFREKELDYRLRTINAANRQDAESLAELFRARKQPKEAAEALAQWVKAQEPKWRKEGPSGLLSLAEATQRLLNDKKRAAELLIEADRQAPGWKEIEERLKSLGYEKRNGSWALAEKVRIAQPNPLLQAVQKGNVVSGMSPAQVRRVMAGTPKSIHRAATSGSINEVWLFQRADGSRLAVHFRRFRNQPRSEARVHSVSALPAR